MIKIIEDVTLLNDLLNRNQFEYSDVNQVVEEILNQVKEKKDEALKAYTLKFDKVKIDDFKVSEKEISEAYENLDKALIKDLKQAWKNIRGFHEKQLPKSYAFKNNQGITLGQLVKPIQTVGIYVPGGSAAYPSTVLMNAVPAKIAGVKKIVMITPPNKEGKIKDSILVAAKIAGVDEVYKVGGAQGIAALTFGTETIPKVNKIVGPGNIYVSMAKRKVSGYVGIDMIAGPSEILIIADETGNPDYIAADLMSQAEHDVLAASILVTTSQSLAEEVVKSIEKQIKSLERKDIIESSLKDYGAIVLTNSLDDAIKISNEIAPEHLEVHTKDPFVIYPKIENAGAIFLGEYTPEAVGDYYAGPNHTLPTSQTAKFSSPLSTTDFIKKTSLIYYDKKNLKQAKNSIIRLADEEGLTAHANSVKVRDV